MFSHHRLVEEVLGQDKKYKQIVLSLSLYHPGILLAQAQKEA